MARFIRKKKIIVPSDTIIVIAARFGCKRVAVYNALAFRSKSDLAEKIRTMAVTEFKGRCVSIPMFKEEAEAKY